MSSRRVLVTGSSGFVGANLVRRLLRDGHDVHLLLRAGYRPWRLEDVAAHCSIHLCDIENADAVRETVTSTRPEWVFHLAVYGAYPTQQDPLRTMHGNVMGTAHLVEACLQTPVEVFINTGSSSEYGPKSYAPAEGDLLNPVSTYGVSKAAGTQYCTYVARYRNLPARTLRLYSTYGPWEEPTRLIPTLLQHAAKATLPPLANPAAAHDFVYVDDVVEAYLLAALVSDQEPGAVYNVGTGTQTTLAELVSVVKRTFHVAEEPVWGSLPSRPWDTNIWVADARKAASVLGWRPKVSLEDGLRRTAGWQDLTLKEHQPNDGERNPQDHPRTK